MKPRITVLTLGVEDSEGALAFYRDGLGLPTRGIVGREYEHGAVVFFELDGGLGLYARDDLAWDSGMPCTARDGGGFSIGHNMRIRLEVDSVLEQARSAGARIVKPAQDTFWGGYAEYFQDPDRHLWEIVWNPQLLPPE